MGGGGGVLRKGKTRGCSVCDCTSRPNFGLKKGDFRELSPVSSLRQHLCACGARSEGGNALTPLFINPPSSSPTSSSTPR